MESDAKLTRNLVLVIVAFSPMISAIVNLPLHPDVEHLTKTEPLDVDGICASFFFVVIVSLIFKPPLGSVLAIASFVSWMSGFASSFGMLPLLIDLCIIFSVLGSSNLTARHQTLIIATCFAWMKGSIFALVIVVATCLAMWVPSIASVIRRNICIGFSLSIAVCSNVLFSGNYPGVDICLTALHILLLSVVKNDRLGLTVITFILLSSCWLVNRHSVLFVSVVVGFLLFRPNAFVVNEETSLGFLASLLVREVVSPSPGLTRIGFTGAMSTIFIGIFFLAFLCRAIAHISNLIHEDVEKVSLGLVIIAVAWSLLDHCLRAGVPIMFIFFLSAFAISSFAKLYIRETIHVKSRISLIAMVVILLLWVAFSIAYARLLTREPVSWLEMSILKQKRVCANLATSPHSRWYRTLYSKSFAVWNLNAVRSLETISCLTSFPERDNLLASRSIEVVGDSVGRFVFYSFANTLISEEFGFPRASFHGDINASPRLKFTWAAFVNETADKTSSMTNDILVMSVGLWDKLWRRDAVVFGQSLQHFVESLNSRPKDRRPLIVWLEMTPTQDNNLIGDEKKLYLTESSAPKWRETLSNSTKGYFGPYLVVPTTDLLATRVARDGVHYDVDSYFALSRRIMRMVTLKFI